MKKAGVLMPISSLPSRFGIGDFGNEAYVFAKKMKKTGFSIWQVLPLNPLGDGNSPYQSVSSKAIDEIYVSPEMLYEVGLISTLPKSLHTEKVCYEKVRELKRKILIEAFEAFIPNEELATFASQEWVKEYAEFSALKEEYKDAEWSSWQDVDKTKKKDSYQLKYDLHVFTQYVLYSQFTKWKKYLEDLGIELLGDLPFYVGYDSADVYFHRENFLLDQDGRPEWIAGVPPDYFSEEGQRWGNPIYDWDHMKEDNFSFWFDRFHHLQSLYDIIRIDHFRAFDTYWKIPANCPTAIDGEWVENCGDEFFEKLFTKYPNMNIVAEDLGFIRDEVRELRDKYNLPGMAVLEFNYKGPFKENEIAYIDTHDNASLLSWYKELGKRDKTKFRNYLKKQYPSLEWNEACIPYLLSLPDKIAILSIVDIMQQETRINYPGTVNKDNWTYRLTDRSYSKHFEKLRKYLKNSKRYHNNSQTI